MTKTLPPAPTDPWSPWVRPAGAAAPTPPTPPTEPTEPTPPTEPADRSRAGAIWVTGMGAFLLFASAAVFVAVQWDRIANEVKLGVLALLTGGFLVAGRRLRSVLPATGGILSHLGAFLIPVNVAAIGLSPAYRLPWAWLVLVEGVVATGAWTALNRVEHSKVLTWATRAGVVVTAAGAGAVTGLPAPLVLAGCAVVAELLHRHREATVWALVAGLAPAVALSEHLLPIGTGVLATLGLTASTPQLLALGTGTLTAAVLARSARRSENLVLVVLAALAGAIGAVTAWVGFAPSRSHDLVGAAMLFVLAEVAVHAFRNDPFWSRPGRALGVLVEVLAALAVPCAVVAALWSLLRADAPALHGPELAAGVLVAIGWFLADLRRRVGQAHGLGLALLLGAGWWPATLGFSAAVMTAVAAGSGSLTATSIAAVALAGALVISGRGFGQATAAVLVLSAPFLTWQQPALTMAVSLAGALVLAATAIIRAGLPDRADNAPLAWLAALGSLVTLLEADALLVGQVPTLHLLLGTVAAGWLLGAVLDLAPRHDDVKLLGTLGRLGSTIALALAALPELATTPREVAIVAGAISVLALLDAARLRSPLPAFALPVSLPVLVASAALASHTTVAQAGLAVCVLAAVTAGVQLLLPARWTWPAVAVIVASGVSGLYLAEGDLPLAYIAVMILGGIGLAYSVVHRSVEGAVFSGLVIIGGIWGELATNEVHALDAYLAPVAAMLAVAGWRARTTRLSSWVSYGPAIVLLGGSGLLERVHGGAGAHALVAGGVGVAALLAGGAKRLAAPLLLGSALLLGLTGYESLAVTREVPTWGWLALGGSVLVAAGIAMERMDRGPLETGRRLVDVVSERFS